MACAVTADTPLSPLVVAVVADSAPSGGGTLLRDDDRAIIESCRGGDSEAFGRLVERYQREVYRLCYRYVDNHEDASELAQDVFVKAYRALGRFRGDSSFSTWLYRIAVNTCLNHRASAAFRLRGGELPELIDQRPGPGEGLEREERARRVREAVSRLPRRQRETLILKIYHELSHEQVAEVLGSSVGTTKANLFHALGNLRRLLGAAGQSKEVRA